MSTRYCWMTAPTRDKSKAIADYHHIKEKLFGDKDTTHLQLVDMHIVHCVIFTTREFSSENPYDTFYALDIPVMAYITDESTGGYLE